MVYSTQLVMMNPWSDYVLDQIESRQNVSDAIFCQFRLFPKLPQFASVSKRVFMPNHSYENVFLYSFIFTQIKLMSSSRFCMRTRFETEAQGRYFRNDLLDGSEIFQKQNQLCCQTTIAFKVSIQLLSTLSRNIFVHSIMNGSKGSLPQREQRREDSDNLEVCMEKD